jgi:hypothetical protein
VNAAAGVGSWEAWVTAFEKVYANPSRIAEVRCPSCGARDLRIEFTGDEGPRIGYASFWCQNCFNGIFTSRLHIPAGIQVVPFDLPPEDREKIIPRFNVIPPDPSEDEDSESAVF